MRVDAQMRLRLWYLMIIEDTDSKRKSLLTKGNELHSMARLSLAETLS
jgi:hypothetical protein